MKILILQTARFGDILQTFPVINSLKRSKENIEIHYLARERFSSILDLNSNIDKVHILDSKSILEPIIMSPFEEGYDDGTDKALEALQTTLDQLTEENFDHIYNLSFSPMTSYFTHYLCQNSTNTQSFGYTRHQDGFLDFSEDVSAYFYAQVGVGGQNRVHLTDLYATMLGLDYTEQDWQLPLQKDVELTDFNLPNNYIAVHISASQEQKTLNAKQWTEILKANSQLPKFVLLGTKEESPLAEEIAKQADVINLAGRTDLKQLTEIIRQAKGFIGSDSLPMNICSFTHTKCYNISFNSVRFWETGPLSKHSYIRCFNTSKDVDLDLIQKDLSAIFNNAQLPDKLFYYNGNELTQRYTSKANNYDFSWELIKAIYMEEKFPIIDDMNLYAFAEKIGSLIHIIVENLNFAKQSQMNDSHLNIITECETLLHKIGVACRPFRPLINWIYTEKIKIPPGDVDQILERTLSTYNQAAQVMKIYLGEKIHEPVDLVE
ncbi:MAG: hypothetical protein MK008_00090 [Bdellovibrionales bacterium]|nr:hypothetical protein [Bdellovibrionales bacterium]